MVACVCNVNSLLASHFRHRTVARATGRAEPLKLLETLEVSVNNGNLDPQLIFEVCAYLKVNGSYLDESSFRDQLDLYFNSLRNITRDNRLDSLSRSRLLELIELRT